jgi:hypothetical protein
MTGSHSRVRASGRASPVEKAVDVRPRSVQGRARTPRSSASRRLRTAVAGVLLVLGTLAAARAWWLGWPLSGRPDEAIRTDLARHGLGRIDVSVQGRHAHLSGVLPAGVPAGLPVALALAASCSWWGMPRPCADRVSASLQPASLPEPDAGAATAQRVPPVTPRRPQP